MQTQSMPIFNDDITFIHIPKCGGSSIEAFLPSLGWKMSLYTNTSSVFINGHTPQHCTYRELVELNIVTKRVFAVVRPDVDRCVSEYFYAQKYRPDIVGLFDDFDSFLDLFLDRRHTQMFDQHNLPSREFLLNKQGEIEPTIEVIDFFDIPRIETFLGVTGLARFHELRSIRDPNFRLSTEQEQRIISYFRDYEHNP